MDKSALLSLSQSTRILFSAVLFSTKILLAQEYKTTQDVILTNPQVNFYSIGFNKALNTYHWEGNTLYSNTFGPLSLHLNEHFRSNLIRTDRKLITDEQSLEMSLKHRFINTLSGLARISSFILSDNKSIGISNASSHGVYGGLEYTPVKQIHIEPLVGLKIDNQVNQKDRGTSYSLGLTADTVEFDGYATNLQGKIQYDQITPRTLEMRNIAFNVKKNFFKQTRNTAQFQYYRSRREFYFPADSSILNIYGITHNIESRIEDALTFIDSLAYNLNEQAILEFQGNIYSRDISREIRHRTFSDTRRPLLNTDINEIKIEGSTRAIYTTGNDFTSSLQFSYQEREEKHRIQREEAIPQFTIDSLGRIEERKNSHSRRTSLISQTMIGLSSSHRVTISGSGSLLRYDTPSITNDDDRDELWYVLNARTWHRINQHLNLQVVVDANLTHLVYLLSSRSADNTWNRIFRLSPKLEYTPSDDFTTTNTFEVLANYTVYDFEYPSSSIRSFAFRQFGFSDSSTLNLSDRISLEWFSYIRLYERGDFLWTSFSERPVNYFEDKTYLSALRYQMSEGLLFSIGIRYFSQARFKYSGSERMLNVYLRRIGPTVEILWNPSNYASLTMHGWYEHQSQTNVASRPYAHMTFSMVVQI